MNDLLRMMGRDAKPLLVGLLAVVVLPAWGQESPGSGAATVTVNDRSRVRFAELTPAVDAPEGEVIESELSSRAQRAVNRAEELRSNRRFTEAAIELERALRFDADSVPVLRLLALTLWQAGDSERARVYVDKVLAQSDNDIICHYILARLNANQFENTEAIYHFRKALRCDVAPQWRRFASLSRYHLAELLSAEGYTQAAIDLYEQLTEDLAQFGETAKDDPELASIAEGIHERLATGYEAIGQWDRAAAALAKGSSDHAKSPAERMRLARTLARAGQYEKAAQIARELLADEANAASVLSDVYASMGNPEGVLEDLRRAAKAHPDNSQIAFALAKALDRFEQSDEAIALLSGFLARHSTAYDIRWLLFDVYIRHQQTDQALRVAADLIQRRPEWTHRALERVLKVSDQVKLEAKPDIQGDFALGYLYGEIARVQKKYDLAESLLRESLKAKNDFVPTRVSLCEILLNREDWQGVIDVAQSEGIRLEQDSRLAYCLGAALAELDRYEQAVAQLSAAVRLDRTNVEAMLKLADLYSLNNENALYLRQLLSIIDVDPNHETALEQLFRVYLFQENNRRLAAAQLSHLRKIGASPHRIARCVAWLKHDVGDPDWEAFRSGLQEALDSSGPDSETLALVAWSYISQDRLDRAVEALKRSLAHDPKHAPSAELLAQTYRRQLEFEKAIELQEQLLARYPNREVFQDGLVSLLMIVQRYDEAIALMTRLSEADETGARAARYRPLIVQTHLARKQFDQAISVLKKWRDEAREMRNVLVWLVQAYQMAGRHDEAMQQLRKWNERDPGGPAWAGNRVWRNLLPKNRVEVEQMILDGIIIDPENDIKQLALIEFLLASERYDEAVALVRNNRAEAPHNDLYDEVLLIALRRAGRYAEAIDAIDQLILKMAPRDKDGNIDQKRFKIPENLKYDLIDLLIRAKQYDQAASRLNQWIEESPSEEEKLIYLRLLAQCHQESGKSADAVEVLRLAHDIAPDDVNLNNDFGYTLTEADQDLEQAEVMIRKAVAGSPRTAAYLDSLGWVLYKRGKLEEAKLWLLRAKNAGDLDDEGNDLGDDPVIYDHLGDTYWRLGEKDKARAMWVQAVEFARRRLRIEDRLADRTALEGVERKLEAIDKGEKPQIATITESTN